MTQAQFNASHPAHSVWVSASAGTGKTKVLTDRVLRLLLSGVAPDRIQCITFTNAGAAEMERRIFDRLRELSVISDALLVQKYEALTGMIPNENDKTRARILFATVLDSSARISIQTIHAFSKRIIQHFPVESGVMPGVEMMDDSTRMQLLKEAYYSLLMEVQCGRDTHLQAAFNVMAIQAEEQGIRDLLMKGLQKNNAWSDAASVQKMIEILHHFTGVDGSVSEEQILREMLIEELTHQEKLKQLHGICSSADASSTEQKQAASIAPWLEFSPQQKIQRWQSDYVLIFFTQSGEAKAERSLISKKSRETYPHLWEWILEEQRRIEQLIERVCALRLVERSSAFIRVMSAFSVHYAALKKRYGVMDYQDLIDACARLLSNAERVPWVLAKLDTKIEHILVDEAQDTSLQQWNILSALWEELLPAGVNAALPRSVFVVGDEKQSIYRFQGAAPEWFQHMQTRLGTMMGEIGQEWHEIMLEDSFRSAPEILRAVDAACRHPLMRKALSAENHSIVHRPKRVDSIGHVELWPLCESDEKEERAVWEIPSSIKMHRGARAQLAEKIAAQLHQWFTEKRLLKNHHRAVQPSDVMILIRQRDEQFLPSLMQELQARSIPIASTDRLVLQEHLVIRDILAWARFLLLPADDLNLAALLKSPLCGISEQELMVLATERGEKTLWHYLQEKTVSDSRFAHVHQWLSQCLERMIYGDLLALFVQLIEVENMRARFVAEIGEEAHRVIDGFLQAVEEFEREHISSLQHFVAWFDGGRIEVKSSAERASGVRILTVHGAKGLQAPIVILPDTTLPPSTHEPMQWLEHVTPSVPLWPGVMADAPRVFKELSDREKEAAREEYFRLLYVALTRAEDELYVAGFMSGRGERNSSWYSVLKESWNGVV